MILKKLQQLPFCLILVSSLTLVSCNSPNSDSSSTPSQSSAPGGTISGNPGDPSLLDSEETAFVTLINNWRIQNGVPALQLSPILIASSKWMSQDMANHDYLDHTDSLGRDPGTRMAFFGYSGSTWGENVAAGNATAQDTFTQWQNSPAHNANMLDSSFTVFGVGRADNSASTYGWYWTTDFGD